MHAVEITNVAEDLVVLHDSLDTTRFEGLAPATTYTFLGHEVTTLARPSGALLSRFTTVNDVHFGETECGRVGDSPKGPIQRPSAVTSTM